MKNLKNNFTFSLFCLLSLSLTTISCGQKESCKDAFPTGIGYDNVNKDNVIIDGYDVVAFFTIRKPVKGSPDHVATYQGTKYQFSNAANKQTFLNKPEKYRPQYGGWCAVAAARNHIQVISVDYFEILGDRLYLNHNSRAKSIWDKDPAGIVRDGDSNWPCLLNKNGAPFKEEMPISVN